MLEIIDVVNIDVLILVFFWIVIICIGLLKVGWLNGLFMDLILILICVLVFFGGLFWFLVFIDKMYVFVLSFLLIVRILLLEFRVKLLDGFCSV